MNQPTRPGGSRAVQGCLFGAVALFVILLIVMLFLAYARFREMTGQADDPISTVESLPKVSVSVSTHPADRLRASGAGTALVPRIGVLHA